MFDADKLLGGLLGSAMGHQGHGSSLGNLGELGNLSGGLASGAGKAGLAMGLLGVAAAAFEHFSDKRGQAQVGAAALGNPPPSPPPLSQGGVSTPGMPSAPPPPPPGATVAHAANLATTPERVPAVAPGVIPAAPPPPPATKASMPAQVSANASPIASAEDEALIYVRGMIAAAAADGYIDQAERERILGRLEQTGLDQEEREFLLREMDQPASIDALGAAVQTPEQALNLYVCSLLAVDVDTDAEREHLRQLSDRLQLSPDALTAVHARYQLSL